MAKQPLSLSEHQHLGADLAGMTRRLAEIEALLVSAYGSRFGDLAGVALRSLQSLRCELDVVLQGENARMSFRELNTVYYPPVPSDREAVR